MTSRRRLGERHRGDRGATTRHTRGIVVLGLDAPEAELAASFETAAGFDLVKGFAVGRTIFGDAARGLARRRDSTTPRPSPRWRDATRGSARIWDKARAAAREAVA